MSASTTARRKLSVHVGWPHPVPAPRRSTEPDAKTRRGCEPTRAAHPLSPQARECGLRLGPRAPTRRLNAAAQFSPRERAHQTRRPRRGEIMDPRPSRGPQHAQRTRPLALRAAPRGLPSNASAEGRDAAVNRGNSCPRSERRATRREGLRTEPGQTPPLIRARWRDRERSNPQPGGRGGGIQRSRARRHRG
jgi:hypothetical protein